MVYCVICGRPCEEGIDACPDCGNRLGLAADGGGRGVIRVHSIAQEYWYIRRQQCECGGRYERVWQALMVDDVDRLGVRCKLCGSMREYDFDISARQDCMMKLLELMGREGEWSSFMSRGEVVRAFSPPMELAVKLISELADNRDELALDYLADVIAHAREKPKNQAADEAPSNPDDVTEPTR